MECKYEGCFYYCVDAYALALHERTCRYRFNPSPQHFNNARVPAVTHEPARNGDHHSPQLSSPDPESGRASSSDSPCDAPLPPTSTPSRADLLVQSLAASLTTLEYKAGAGRVSEVITILQDPAFSLEKFNSAVRTVEECRHVTASMVETHFRTEGYKSHIIPDKTGKYSAQLYLRDPVDMLRRQLALANDQNTLFHPSPQTTPDGTAIFSHPLHTDFAKTLHQVTRQRVQLSDDPQVVWAEETDPTPSSFAGLLQVYSDKSSTSLKSSAIVAYPIHVTLLNFSAPLRRHCIRTGLTIVGYLPYIVNPSSNALFGDEMPTTSSSASRARKIDILHKALEKVFSSLSTAFSSGFPCTDSTATARQCFPILANYCCDFPEAKELSCTRNSTTTTHPCHRCYIPATQLESSAPHQPRSLDDTRSARQESAQEHTTAPLEALSLLEQHSVLESTALLPTNSPLDPYNIFSFEPLHNLHLGISKLIKQCIVHRLSSPDLTTTTASRSGTPRTFKKVKKSILVGSNSILSAIERDYYITGLHVDFSKGEKGTNLNGLFTEDGIRGMLSAKDYHHVDMVFPFIAAFIDTCCDEVETAPLTSICTQYSDLVAWVMKRGRIKHWTAAELESLQNSISYFKQSMLSTLGPFHTTGLKTFKFHLLDHLPGDLQRYGALEHIDAGPYEHSHLLFKQSYRKTSRRRSTAMEETIRHMEVSLATPTGHTPSNTLGNPRMISPTDGAVLVRDGFTIALHDFASLLPDATLLVADIDGQPDPATLLPLHNSSFPSGTIKLFQQLGDTAAQAFLTLARLRATAEGPPIHDMDISVTVVKSAYVMGGYVPDADDFDPHSGMLRPTNVSRHKQQRVFATSSFGPAKRSQYSFVVISGTADDYRTIWVGRVLALVRLQSPNLSQPVELAFVQYMTCFAPKTAVEKSLGCICLKWSTWDPDNGSVDSNDTASHSAGGPWFDLIPASTISGTVHIVRSNFPVKPFTKQMHWSDHRFYLNRFYTNTDYQFTDDNEEE